MKRCIICSFFITFIPKLWATIDLTRFRITINLLSTDFRRDDYDTIFQFWALRLDSNNVLDTFKSSTLGLNTSFWANDCIHMYFMYVLIYQRITLYLELGCCVRKCKYTYLFPINCDLDIFWRINEKSQHVLRRTISK